MESAQESDDLGVEDGLEDELEAEEKKREEQQKMVPSSQNSVGPLDTSAPVT